MARYLAPLLIVAVLLIAGCGPTGAEKPSPTPASTPTQAPTPTPKPKFYSAPPDMVIDQNKNYTAIIETAKGNITLQLFAKDVPITVNNFVFLARDGFYDNTSFHRVMKDFMGNLAIIWLVGILTLVAGLAIINVHNLWE